MYHVTPATALQVPIYKQKKILLQAAVENQK